MIYPKKGTFEKSSKGRNTKYLRAGDDSELKALNQLLHDLDEEIDQKKFGERKKKYDRELDEKTKHKRRKKRNTTPVRLPLNLILSLELQNLTQKSKKVKIEENHFFHFLGNFQ